MVFEKISKILCEQLELEESQIAMDSSITEDLGADSLDLVDLLMSLEDQFGLEVPDEDVEKIKTVGDMVRYVEERQ